MKTFKEFINENWSKDEQVFVSKLCKIIVNGFESIGYDVEATQLSQQGIDKLPKVHLSKFDTYVELYFENLFGDHLNPKHFKHVLDNVISNYNISEPIYYSTGNIKITLSFNIEETMKNNLSKNKIIMNKYNL